MGVIGFRDAVGSGFVCALFVSARSIHRFCFNCEYNKPALGVLFLVTCYFLLVFGLWGALAGETHSICFGRSCI